jgi:nitroimidazol reductase NimA-like FMN-containing flavoprotein (pyridoxamine 5'-phosphate oxidase superfamily)
MEPYSPTPRTIVHRMPARGTYDRAAVHEILDEALVCHIGFVADEHPFVIPTAFVRDGELLYVHGAAASRMLRALAGGVPICATVTLLDGLVFARSAFHHSMNYRSVVVLGPAREVTDRDERLRAFGMLVDKLSRGRSSLVRSPNEKELRATRLLAIALEEVSAKARRGPPVDDEEDADVPVWAGVVPLALRAGVPEPDGEAAARFGAPDLPSLDAPRRVAGPREG